MKGPDAVFKLILRYQDRRRCREDMCLSRLDFDEDEKLHISSLKGLYLFSKVRDRTVGKEKGIGDKHKKTRKIGMPAVRSMCGLSKL